MLFSKMILYLALHIKCKKKNPLFLALVYSYFSVKMYLKHFFFCMRRVTLYHRNSMYTLPCGADYELYKYIYFLQVAPLLKNYFVLQAPAYVNHNLAAFF